MSKNVFILSLEPIDTRYTAQWKTHIPESLTNYAEVKGLDVNVVDIEGKTVENKTTPGAFLDFAATNIWKCSQMEQVSELFKDQKVQEGDVFLLTDFWNPCVFQLKYMSMLFNIPVKIIGIAHAGSYDPNDFLGRVKGVWSTSIEEAFFHNYDRIIFATDFHRKMFMSHFNITFNWSHKLVRSGFPMEYFPSLLEPFTKETKRDLILFPHRLAPEKQVSIFKDLAEALPQYEWKICQESRLTKDEYHKLLGQSKLVFSANLQETLGIGCIEAIFSNAAVLVPDRLSYSEMYEDTFKYPSNLSINYDHYINNKEDMINHVKYIMDHYNDDHIQNAIKDQQQKILEEFINPDIMYKEILS